MLSTITHKPFTFHAQYSADGTNSFSRFIPVSVFFSTIHCRAAILVCKEWELGRRAG